MTTKHQTYYVPSQSIWPIVGAIGLFFIAVGAGLFVQQMKSGASGGGYLLLLGIAVIVFMLVGWFSAVIKESTTGLYSAQMDRSFRQGMSWFIFSEVMFFAAFFGALFYARAIAVPWLGGASNNAMTHEILWPSFEAVWPLISTPDGTKTEAMPWTGLPLINTLILLISSVTLHFAHISLEKAKRSAVVLWLGITILLGIGFVGLQVEEYRHAYQEMGLTSPRGFMATLSFC